MNSKIKAVQKELTWLSLACAQYGSHQRACSGTMTMTVQNNIDVSNVKHENRRRDSPYPLAVAVAVAVAAAAATAVAVAVGVSDMAGEERISAGSDVSCFEVAS